MWLLIHVGLNLIPVSKRGPRKKQIGAHYTYSTPLFTKYRTKIHHCLCHVSHWIILKPHICDIYDLIHPSYFCNIKYFIKDSDLMPKKLAVSEWYFTDNGMSLLISFIAMHLSVPYHDDITTWKHFLCYWPFVRGITPRTGIFPSHEGSVIYSFGVFFFVSLNELLKKQ